MSNRIQLAIVATLFIANGASGADERQLFRFAQVNDLHVQAADPPPANDDEATYEQANEKARYAVDAITKLSPPCDFVVGVGDLVNGCTLQRLAPDHRALKEILEPLSCPFYPVIGNHEVVQQERTPQYLQAYCNAFGDDRAEYTYMHGSILFVALNDSGAPGHDVAQQRIAWLRKALAAARGLPKIILCHIPLIPVRDEETLVKSFGFGSEYDHDGGTLQLVEEHRESVIAVLSGHLHMTGVRQRNGIYHIVIAGTASYPSDFAVYDVYADRIEVAVEQLPERLRHSAPSIHGAQRRGREFTDADHQTPDEYQCGRADERRFTIPLAGSKRPSIDARTAP